MSIGRQSHTVRLRRRSVACGYPDSVGGVQEHSNEGESEPTRSAVSGPTARFDEAGTALSRVAAAAAPARRRDAGPTGVSETPPGAGSPRYVSSTGNLEAGLGALRPNPVRLAHTRHTTDPRGDRTDALRARDVLRLQRVIGNRGVTRLLTRRPTFTLDTTGPVRAEEAGNQFVPTMIVNGKFAVFVPAAWIWKYNFADPTALTNVKVHVFFGAGAVSGKDNNDLLLHGLRSASNVTEWITIGVFGSLDPRGNNIATPFNDSDIADCLTAAGILSPVTSLRLTGHSRGAVSLVAYVQKTKLKKAVDRVTLLDEFQFVDPDGNYHGKVESIRAALPNAPIRGYETQNPARKDGEVHHVAGVDYRTIDPQLIARVGAVRLIQDAIALDPTLGDRAANINTRKITDPNDPKKKLQLTLKDEVDQLSLAKRGSLSSKASDRDSIQTWMSDHQKELNAFSLGAAVSFINSQGLGNYKAFNPATKKIENQNWARFVAHEFFVNEIARDLYD